MYGRNQVLEKLIMDFYALQILIQEELVGLEIRYKPLNFPPSCPDYP